MSHEPKFPKGFVEVIPEREVCDEAQEAMISDFVSSFLDPSNIPVCYSYLNTTPNAAEDKRIVAYKYLMARKWKVADATKMFQDTVNWRESHKYHENPYFPSAIQLRGYDESMLQGLYKAVPRKHDRVDNIVARVRPGYKFAIHKWDKFGHPVIIDLTGRLNPKYTIAALKELAPPGVPISEPFVLLRAYQNELCQFLIRSQDTVFQQQQQQEGVEGPLRRVTSVTGIMDMSGLSMDHCSGELIDAIKSMLASTQAYYPEMSYRTFIVNCSSVVMFAFNIVKGWMDPRARNKLVFCSVEETPHVLRSVIDEEHLPAFLGGKCVCDGGCVCEEEKEIIRHAQEKQKAKESGESSHHHHADIFHIPEVLPIVLGKEPDRTLDFHVAAGATTTKAVNVRAGQTVSWHWCIPHEGHHLDFIARHGGESAAATTDLKKVSEDKGSFKCPTDGVFDLVFNNEGAWLKSKNIRLRVEITSA